MWQYNYDYYDLASDELMHYGVPGMKWGIEDIRTKMEV